MRPASFRRDQVERPLAGRGRTDDLPAGLEDGRCESLDRSLVLDGKATPVSNVEIIHLYAIAQAS